MKAICKRSAYASRPRKRRVLRLRSGIDKLFCNIDKFFCKALQRQDIAGQLRQTPVLPVALVVEVHCMLRLDVLLILTNMNMFEWCLSVLGPLPQRQEIGHTLELSVVEVEALLVVEVHGVLLMDVHLFEQRQRSHL